MAVTLTDSAAQHVQRFLAKRGKGIGLRLGVRTSGCSGLAYKLEYADDGRTRTTSRSRATASRCSSIRRACRTSTARELDFAREGLNEGFKFNNPNVKDECGCGESFNV